MIAQPHPPTLQSGFVSITEQKMDVSTRALNLVNRGSWSVKTPGSCAVWHLPRNHCYPQHVGVSVMSQDAPPPLSHCCFHDSGLKPHLVFVPVPFSTFFSLTSQFPSPLNTPSHFLSVTFNLSFHHFPPSFSFSLYLSFFFVPPPPLWLTAHFSIPASTSSASEKTCWYLTWRQHRNQTEERGAVLPHWVTGL